jgi:3D (Asp-Asp-Asp) domain-containing protein
MIRYIVGAVLLIPCVGLPLRAGTLAPMPPVAHKPVPDHSSTTAQSSASTSVHTEDKAPKILDATVAKLSIPVVKESMPSVPHTAVSDHSSVTAQSSTSTPAHAEDKAPKILDATVTRPSTPVAEDKAAKITDTTVGKTPNSTKEASSKPVAHVASSGENKGASAAVSKTTDVSNDGARTPSGNRLARITAYWASEGDYYTSQGISSTGIHLHDGYCAVDPTIIPYGSVVTISGLGKYLAVDTGSAVISRTAARETGHNATERAALVIDIYFESRRDGEDFAANGPKYASITWQAPDSTNRMSAAVRNMVAETDWNKLRNKVLSE